MAFKTKSLSLSQNIKKKDAAASKGRPMGSGLLPPPPGAKGAFLPPLEIQQSAPPTQSNTGNFISAISGDRL